MPDRRQFLQAAAALSAAPAIPVSASAGEAPVPLALVVYDDRYEASRAFGRAALALGARVRRISGDVTPLWSEELYPLWRERPVAIAGLTDRAAMFCFEQIGWDARMRLAHRISHAHETGAEWAAGAAQTLLAQTLSGPAPEMLTMAAGEADERTLYSWIIAPAAGRARAQTA